MLDTPWSTVFAGASAEASNNGVTLATVDAYPSSVSGDGYGWVNRFVADVYKFQGYIFGFGLGVSTLFAFAYLYLLRIPGLLSAIIWGIIIGVDVALVAFSFMLWSLASQWEDDGEHSQYEANTMYAFAYIGMAAVLIYTCLIIVLGKRVQLAIAIVKEAARALASMPIMIFTPVFQVLAIVIFLVPWFIYVLYLVSSGDMSVDSTTGVKTFTYDTNSKYAFIYMVSHTLSSSLLYHGRRAVVLLVLDLGVRRGVWTTRRGAGSSGVVLHAGEVDHRKRHCVLGTSVTIVSC